MPASGDPRSGEAARCVGFLHTSAVHVEPFGELMAEVDPSFAHRHIVRTRLLDRARAVGLEDRELHRGVREALVELPVAPGSVVVCTCSTIGAIAEGCGEDLGLRVLRVDRPMAELAVRSGRRLAVLATLASTLAPTKALLDEAAREAGVRVTIHEVLCADAWEAFQAGDQVGYVERIAVHLEALEDSIEVAVLAQASMAPAAQLVTNSRPMLASPRLAVEAAVALSRVPLRRGAHP
ncbi:MAG TPA: hypothetical protein VGI76_11465 [Solirubrobacteraceae bacterium]